MKVVWEEMLDSELQRWVVVLPIHSGTTTEVILSELLGGKLRATLQKKIEGEYEFIPLDNGTKTEVAYHLAADLAILIPGFVKRRAESRIVRAALEALSARIDSVATA